MAVIRLPQNSFSNGILIEDRLRGRYDLKQYLAGVREGHNVHGHPQGGLYRRPGSLFMDDYTEKLVAGKVRFAKFDYSDEIAYFMVFYDDNIDVYRDNVLVYTITDTDITGDQLRQFDCVQRANGLIIVHSTFAPKELFRGVNDVTWTLQDITFDSVPLFGFSLANSNPNNTSNPAATLTPSAVSGVNVILTAGSAIFSAADIGKFVFFGSASARIVHYTDATHVVADVITQFPNLTAMGSGLWTLDAAAIRPSAVSGNVRVVSAGNQFSSTDVGGYITGNGGEARIVEYISPSEVTARVTLPFVDTNPIPSGQWTLENGYADAWSDPRGWPRSVAYENDSLIFGGTKSLPDIFWKSYIGSYYNFDDTRATADGALTTNVRSEDINDIRFMISGNDFIILTSEAEFYVDGELTPELRFNVRKQEERGCRAYIKPLFVDGAPIYIDARADVLRELTYSDVDAKYSSTNLTLFCPGLLKDPVALSHQRSFGSRDNDYVWILNADGTWVIFNTLRKQDINGFTTASSRNDKLIAAEDLNGVMYAMFERSIDGDTKYYLERFDFDLKMDCCHVYSGAATTTITGLDHLEGESVKVIVDGMLHTDRVVVDGEIELDDEYSDVIVGFQFKPRVTTLPPPAQLPDGTSIGQIRRMVAASVGFSNTGECTVNGQPIRTRRFGQDIFDSPPPSINGRKRVTLRGGYNRDPVVTIEQEEPLDFHITDLVLEVQV